MMNKKKNFFALLITGLLSLHCFGMEQEVRLPATITIQTNDEHQHVVPINLYILAGTIRNLVEDMGEDATTTPVPLPCISNHIWNLLVPLLPHIQTEQREEIRNLLQQLSLQELSKIFMAAGYLNIPFLIDCIAEERHSSLTKLSSILCAAANFQDIPIFIDCIAEKIADWLIVLTVTPGFLPSGEFLCNTGLCSQPNCTHGKNTESLPPELSQLIVTKIWAQRPDVRAHILDNAPCAHYYLQNEITIEQSLLLIRSYVAMQAHAPLELFNYPCSRFMEIFNSINCPDIKEVLIRTNMVVYPDFIRYIRLYLENSPAAWAIIIGLFIWLWCHKP